MRHASSGPLVEEDGPDSDIVVSCRVRLARNLSGFPFVNRATDAQRHQVIALIQRAALDSTLGAGTVWINLMQASPRDRQILVERHLISRQLAEGTTPRAVAISPDQRISVMVNEEDHLRLQVLLPGQQLGEAYERADSVDDALESVLDVAFSRRWGYLTACPTNVGCGIRVSVMVHLPALRMTGEIERVRRAAKELHLAVRGFYGEGSDSTGDLYQVSNQVTLGLSEQDLLEHFRTRIVPKLIEYEREARRMLSERNPAVLEDRLHRALGVLSNARLMGFDEAMKLLSRLRLGACLGRLPISLATVRRLYLQIQPAHLQLAHGAELTEDQMRECRATLIRGELGSVK